MSMMVIDPYRFTAADTFIMPYRQDVMAWSSVDGSSGITYTRTQSSAVLSGGLGNDSGSADADVGDYMEWFVNLAAGTYTLTVVHLNNSDQGIIRFKLDGTSLGTVDCYAASVAYNDVDEFAGIVVAADGNYTLRAEVDSKHASSADYRNRIQSLTLTRTGA